MTYEQIIALTEKGFTPSQVMQLAGERDSPDPKPVPEAPPADPEPVPEAPPSDPEQAPEVLPADPEPAGKLKVMQLPDLSGLIDSVKTMGQQIEALTRANQANNIKTISQNVSPDSIEQGADAILAGIIHPPIEKKKED